MAGSPLSSFTDFVTTTGPAYLTSKEDVINDALKQSYYWSRFIRGKGMDELVQGGSSIKDDILFNEQTTAITHLPGHTFTWQNPQVLKEWAINWRFITDHMAYIEQEIMFNAPESMTGRGRFMAYKNMKYKLEQRLYTSMWNFMESKIWAAPNTTQMESSTGTEPYSLPCFINEWCGTTTYEGNGLFGTGSSLSADNKFTTVQGLAPSAAVSSGRWANEAVHYNTAEVGTPGTVTAGINIGVVEAFDRMFLRLDYHTPSTWQQYFEQSPVDQVHIACSAKGMQHYWACLRTRQDLFVAPGRQDPGFTGAAYRGIPLVYVTALDTAAIYPNHNDLTLASSLQTEGTANTNAGTSYIADGPGRIPLNGDTLYTEDTESKIGPRYYWIHPKYIKYIFHDKRYFYQRPAITPTDQPEATIVPVSTWCNMVAKMRSRLGIVFPFTDGAAAGTQFVAY